MFKSFFRAGTPESMMRLASFLAIVCIVMVVLDIVAIPLIALFNNSDLEKIPPILTALAQVIGALSLIIFYKGVQSFAEHKKGGKDETKDSGNQEREKPADN